MAYNSYSDIEAIVYGKKAYDDAKARADSAGMNAASNSVQKNYANLYNNGYQGLADKLKNSGYTDADRLRKQAGTQGRTAFRPYVTNLAKQYGLSEADVDKLLSYNTATGELSIGGMNIGKPDSNVDGTTYFNDSGAIDNAWNSYVNKMGLSTTPENKYLKGLDNVQSKLDRTYELTMSDHNDMGRRYDRLENYGYSNPYDTEIADAIMSDYKWQGKSAADNAAAEGASSNGGNIDSYAAANASRQQLAFTNAGKKAVLEDFNNRLGNIRAVLSDRAAYDQGIYGAQHDNIGLDMQNNQRIFENDQTAKLNAQNTANAETERRIALMNATGYIPTALYDELGIGGTNIYLNSDGTLKSEYSGDNTDFQAIYNSAMDMYNKTGDSTYKKQADDAMTARDIKIRQNPEAYGKYAKTQVSTTPYETAAMRQNAAANASQRYVTDAAERENNYNTDAALRQAIYGIDANERMNNYNTDASTRMNADDNYTSRYNAALGLEGTKYGIDSNERISNAELKENGRQFDRQYDIQNLLAQNTAPAEETTYTPRLTAAQAYKAYNDAVKNGNSVTDSLKRDYEYWYGSNNTGGTSKSGSNLVKDSVQSGMKGKSGGLSGIFSRANSAAQSLQNALDTARTTAQAYGKEAGERIRQIHSSPEYQSALPEARAIVEDARKRGNADPEDELTRYLYNTNLGSDAIALMINELLGE